MILSIDEKVQAVNVEPTPITMPLTDCPSSNELLRQLQLAKYENEALRAYLANELGKLKRENEELKRKLQDVPLNQEQHIALQIDDPSAGEVASQTVHVTGNNDEMVKLFTAIPKKLDTFYNEMEHGTDKMPKFSDLPENYRTSKRTKGSYSKRKAIYTFISNSGGIEECLKTYGRLSPLQLYEQHIKRARVL